ncbi:MAG: hypothetical protein Q4C37_07970 [Bacteroidales bacterium]|nr:hypothetical protein [Bacteroidales bacterium]
MKRIINILLMIPLMWTICSCSTSDITTAQSQDKYVDLYQKAYESLKSQLSETRASEYGQEITAEEIESINTLEKLTAYDVRRLEEIEYSRVYQDKYKRALAIEKKTKEYFIETHSQREFNILMQSIEGYIKKGTHNTAALQATLQTHANNKFLQEQITMSFALVDAYGEYETWNNTLQIASLTPCDQAALEQVVLVLAITTINLCIDSTMPWMAIINAASTIESICRLITIRNNWIRCKRLNHEIS